MSSDAWLHGDGEIDATPMASINPQRVREKAPPTGSWRFGVRHSMIPSPPHARALVAAHGLCPRGVKTHQRPEFALISLRLVMGRTAYLRQSCAVTPSSNVGRASRDPILTDDHRAATR